MTPNVNNQQQGGRPSDFPAPPPGQPRPLINQEMNKATAAANAGSAPSGFTSGRGALLDDMFANDFDEPVETAVKRESAGMEIEGLGSLDEEEQESGPKVVPFDSIGEGEKVVVLSNVLTSAIPGEIPLTRGRVTGISKILTAWGKGDGNGGPKDLRLAREQMKRLIDVKAVRVVTQDELREAEANFNAGRGSFIELASDSESPTVKLQREKTLRVERELRTAQNRLSQGVPHGPSSEDAPVPTPPGMEGRSNQEGQQGQEGQQTGSPF